MASGVNQPVPSTLTDRPCRHQPTDQNLTTTRPNFRQTLNRHDNRPSLFLFFPPHKKIELLPHTFYTFGTFGFARYTKANASQTQKSQAHPPPTNRGLKRLFFTKRKKNLYNQKTVSTFADRNTKTV